MDRKTVDMLKGLAMVAVIVIHTNAGYFQIDKWLGSAWTWKLIIDQVMRWCVPVFVALSGYGLAAKYQKATFSLKDFYVHRVGKLLPWYIVFTTLVYFSWPHSESYLQALIWGTADYHLYFVPLIFQLYVIFPLVWYVVRKWPVISLALTVGWQIAWFWVLARWVEPVYGHNLFWTDYQQYVVFFSWISYFVLGIYLATQENLGRILKIVAPILLVGGFVWATANAYGLVHSGVNLVLTTRFTRIPVLVFASGVILVANYWSNILAGLPDRLKGILVVGGEVSYVVYLLHTSVLRLFAERLGWQSLLPYPLFLVLVIGVSFMASWVLVRLVAIMGARAKSQPALVS